jgi:hypothetical protein
MTDHGRPDGPIAESSKETSGEPPLRLRACDEEDLAIFSAMLQDALVAVAEMAFLPEERRFVLVANRFCWERSGAELERVLTGIAFSGVRSVRTQGFRRCEADRILEILALHRQEGAVVIEFAGGGCLCLEVESILCHLEDLGEPWITPWKPKHPLDESNGGGGTGAG